MNGNIEVSSVKGEGTKVTISLEAKITRKNNEKNNLEFDEMYN